MIGETAPAPTPLDALLAHLAIERDHLIALVTALDDEAQALRQLALNDLLDAGRRKAAAAEAHTHIARDRLERLHAVDPTCDTLGALSERLDSADRERLDATRIELAGLLDSAADKNAWNHTFAESGKALIEGTLRVMRGRAAGASATYGKGGRIVTGERRARLDRRA